MPDKQTHRVEVILDSMEKGPEPVEERLAKKIEAAYSRLNTTALEKHMVILGTFQQAVSFGQNVCVIITVQWASRADLQEAQMRDMLSGRIPMGKA